jgi:hypothetical protein
VLCWALFYLGLLVQACACSAGVCLYVYVFVRARGCSCGEASVLVCVCVCGVYACLFARVRVCMWRVCVFVCARACYDSPLHASVGVHSRVRPCRFVFVNRQPRQQHKTVA